MSIAGSPPKARSPGFRLIISGLEMPVVKPNLRTSPLLVHAATATSGHSKPASIRKPVPSTRFSIRERRNGVNISNGRRMDH